MVATVTVAVVLFLMVVETVRGFLNRRSGGLKDAFLAFGSAIACVTYLIRDHVSEYFLLAFVLVGLTAALGGFLVVARRVSDFRSHRCPDAKNGRSKRLFWILLAVLTADALAIVLAITATGDAALVIGLFLAINLIAVVVSGLSHRSASASDSQSTLRN